jgi:hypothetical protein
MTADRRKFGRALHVMSGCKAKRPRQVFRPTMLAKDRICLAQEPIRDVKANSCGGFQVDPQER